MVKAFEGVVSRAERAGAKTSVNEMVSVLAYQAVAHMDEDELTAAWLEYRKATLPDLQRALDEGPVQITE